MRVAIVGVGNCASSLVQGVQYYQDADENATVPGLMHVKLGQYHVRDVKFVAAFDVDAKKVGFDLSEAIFASENNTIKIADVPPTNVTVQRGPTLDGIGKYYAETIEVSDADPVDVVKALKDNNVDVLVSYLPVGSEEADKFYAQCAIDAGVAFVNALPVFIASDPVWAKKFEDAGVPIVGDDIKSQVGATITHRVMAKLFEDRGVQLDRTMQLNVGGNMDFLNMLERSRLESKKISKTQAVTSNLQREFNTKDVHIGPSDHVGWLDDRKWAYVRLEGRAFGDVPLNLEYKLEVWDSPNSAGVIIDAVRAAKIAKDRGIGGPVVAASAYLMKSPPQAAARRHRPHAARGPSSRASLSSTCRCVVSSHDRDLRRRTRRPRRVRAAARERRTGRATGPLPPVAPRRPRLTISALKWGDGPPQVVFLHGGGQNAHTWDTVIVGLGVPALAIDLPGHGRSAWREDGDYGPKLNAETLRPIAARVGTRPRLVVGMSLGGLTALRIAATEPALVPELVLVDVTPSAPERHEEMTKAQLGAVALVRATASFPAFPRCST